MSCTYRLVNESVGDFDPTLNHQLFHQCLQKLMVLYELNAVDFCERVEFDEYFMLNYVGK